MYEISKRDAKSVSMIPPLVYADMRSSRKNHGIKPVLLLLLLHLPSWMVRFDSLFLQATRRYAARKLSGTPLSVLDPQGSPTIEYTYEKWALINWTIIFLDKIWLTSLFPPINGGGYIRGWNVGLVIQTQTPGMNVNFPAFAVTRRTLIACDKMRLGKISR